MSRARTLGLFQGYGVECEYMVVDRESLDIRPVVDELFRSIAGDYVSDIECGQVAWSNELVLHVVEMKTNGPAPELAGVAARFDRNVGELNRRLAPMGCRLMPTAAHPWMNPSREMRLWPHEYSPVYEAFNRVFDCRGHGWANLQSCHLNLPFSNDEEFGRLHAAIRLLLPILPALAASSPMLDGHPTGWMDTRLREYRNNCRRIPSIAGAIVPEAVFTRRAYREKVFQPMYRDIASCDPDGVLQDEFLNARGAIARFQRHAIEIRVLDIQECPRADLAILQLIARVLRELVLQRWVGLDRQKSFETKRLAGILEATMKDAESAVIVDPEYLQAFQCEMPVCTAGELWQHLFQLVRITAGNENHDDWAAPMKVILREGSLARRIARALKGDYSRERQKEVYSRLCDCLAEGRMFVA
ncbi:MAG TPA: glutamate--cysteine ligase [Verrucomicrobia bacterium]|nr:MAG: glutamate--cysteine ligase [Lentisphaerae bacterium GWF2_57_35]HBA85360.1 glutamate--cysteine ligase [Verrucomicrobiota bacterium]